MIENMPYHEKVAAVLREEIRTKHAVGDRLPSDRAHAERFDVSVITIGKAMEQLVREGLVRRRQGSGTYVAAPEAGNRVALLVNDTILERVAPYFWLTITRRVREKLITDGYDVEMDLASVSPDDSDGEVRGALAIRAARDSASANYFLQRNIPVVGHDKSYTYCVHHDTEGLVRRGIDRLLERGRRRIAMIATAPEPSSSSWFAEVFRQELVSRDAPCHDEWACSVSSETKGGRIWAWLHEIFNSGKRRPDGLLITDDTLFHEAAMALLSMDVRVPEELMVVTHANRGSGMFCPFPTTKLENDPEQYADAMVRMLKKLLAGNQPEPNHVMIPFAVKETAQTPGGKPQDGVKSGTASPAGPPKQDSPWGGEAGADETRMRHE